jgi:hypothetical protein
MCDKIRKIGVWKCQAFYIKMTRLHLNTKPKLMRVLLTCVLLTASLFESTQKKYQCEYKETIYMTIPNDALEKLRSGFEAQGLPASMLKEFMDQFRAQMMSSTSHRIVAAAADTTFITIKQGKEQTGTFKLSISDQKVMLVKGELYVMDSLGKKYTKSTSEMRKFNPANEQKIILGHTCKKYRSEDSTVIAWITPDLPSYINPGIGIRGVNGAVLGYEIKKTNSAVIGEIDKIK